MTQNGYLIAAAAVAAAIGVVVFYRYWTKCLLKSLDRMLDDAMRGSFAEAHFDESMRSALETKLAHYLAASAASERNLQAEKEKIKTLIADISHQTKTPIANVLLYTQLLGEQALPEGSRMCVAALEAQAEKLQTLIDALVKASRLESGIIVLHPVPGRLDAVMESAAVQLRPKAEARGVCLMVEPTDADAVFDPKWTEEAVFNLLDNAVKYTPAGGSVTAYVTAYPLFAAIQVRDTGPGIPEEEQAKVFQRFYRGLAHQSEEGVGLGLYLVREIARGQGGYVKVASRRGQGCTFSLYLPRR